MSNKLPEGPWPFENIHVDQGRIDKEQAAAIIRAISGTSVMADLLLRLNKVLEDTRYNNSGLHLEVREAIKKYLS